MGRPLVTLPDLCVVLLTGKISVRDDSEHCIGWITHHTIIDFNLSYSKLFLILAQSAFGESSHEAALCTFPITNKV